MSKNKLFIFISLIVGLLVDLCLRLTTGEEGNLVVHSFVIICMTLVVDVCLKYIFRIWE